MKYIYIYEINILGFIIVYITLLTFMWKSASSCLSVEGFIYWSTTSVILKQIQTISPQKVNEGKERQEGGGGFPL